jgi:siroheme synthase
VARGTLPGQRTVTAPLGDIARAAREAGIRSPAVTIVGSVVGLREQIRWFDEQGA